METLLDKCIIIDAEIINAVPVRGERREPDIDYCGGWHDFYGMGISVVCAYSHAKNMPTVFLKPGESNDLQRLIDDHWVVTFNGFNFDAKLLEAHGIIIPPERHYDLLKEVRRALKMDATYQSGSQTGLGLDALAKANGLAGKTGSGAAAPIMWQRGYHSEVIQYCMNDVMVTKSLMDLVSTQGQLIHPKTLKPFAITLDLIK